MRILTAPRYLLVIRSTDAHSGFMPRPWRGTMMPHIILQWSSALGIARSHLSAVDQGGIFYAWPLTIGSALARKSVTQRPRSG